jgi:hypothetical protein
MANTGYKCIYRYDREGRHGGHGYQVNVIWKGKRLYRRISDTSAGGKRKALGLAKQVRAEFERKLGKPRTERIIRSKPWPAGRGRAAKGHEVKRAVR